MVHRTRLCDISTGFRPGVVYQGHREQSRVFLLAVRMAVSYRRSRYIGRLFMDSIPSALGDLTVTMEHRARQKMSRPHHLRLAILVDCNSQL
jgi:hypothetical protein